METAFLAYLIDEIAAAGTSRAVVLVLTPHAATLGSAQYHERALAAAGREDPSVHMVPIPCWHLAPGLADVLAKRA